MIELIGVGLASGAGGILVGWVLNIKLHHSPAPEPALPYQRTRGVARHGHEYTHNPGDGYFYCVTAGCNRRKKLGL
jgi:hypothetical protein